MEDLPKKRPTQKKDLEDLPKKNLFSWENFGWRANRKFALSIFLSAVERCICHFSSIIKHTVIAFYKIVRCITTASFHYSDIATSFQKRWGGKWGIGKCETMVGVGWGGIPLHSSLSVSVNASVFAMAMRAEQGTIPVWNHCNITEYHSVKILGGCWQNGMLNNLLLMGVSRTRTTAG